MLLLKLIHWTCRPVRWFPSDSHDMQALATGVTAGGVPCQTCLAPQKHRIEWVAKSGSWVNQEGQMHHGHCAGLHRSPPIEVQLPNPSPWQLKNRHQNPQG